MRYDDTARARGHDTLGPVPHQGHGEELVHVQGYRARAYEFGRDVHEHGLRVRFRRGEEHRRRAYERDDRSFVLRFGAYGRKTRSVLLL